MKYNWELPDWPIFTYDLKRVENMLYAFAHETGEVSGILQALPNEVQLETLLQTMMAEAVTTSEIEGEILSRADVMSSIRNNLGLNDVPDSVRDKKALGIGRLMVDVRKSFSEPLTEAKLFEWHHLLLDSVKGITVGHWRKGIEPMQVISGSIGKEKIHFQAPPSEKVAEEMKQFIQWFNSTNTRGELEISSAPVKAAVAHLYFESIHPFEDGNGRIGRAIAEKALSQTLGRQVILSLSQVIEHNKSSYYAALEKAQSDNEISEWVEYFVAIVLEAQRKTRSLVGFTLLKTKFFDQYGSSFNVRQLKVINKMLNAGEKGFEGGMTAKKYMSIAKISKATATRDLQELTELGIFSLNGAGRNVHYDIKYFASL